MIRDFPYLGGGGLGGLQLKNGVLVSWPGLTRGGY